MTSTKAFPTFDIKDKKLRYFVPTSSVWTSAKESRSISLMARSEALLYTRLYRVHDLVVGIDFEWRKAGIDLSAIQSRFSSEDTDPDLSLMNDVQLDQLSNAAMKDYSTTTTLRGLIRAFGDANEGILQGARSEDELMAFIYRSMFGKQDAQRSTGLAPSPNTTGGAQ